MSDTILGLLICVGGFVLLMITLVVASTIESVAKLRYQAQTKAETQQQEQRMHLLRKNKGDNDDR